jgi:hypothetical protein
MTSEPPPLPTTSGHPEQRDLISDFRQRQLDIFREREQELDLFESFADR